jgi:putative sigma-54 modulation protein
MEMLLRSTHGAVPAKAKEYAGKKLNRIGRFFHRVKGIEFVYDEQRGQHYVEFIVDADGLYVRGAMRDGNLQSAIDRAIDKIEAQVTKFRKRIIRHHRTRGEAELPEGFAELVDKGGEAAMEEDDMPKIAETRRLNTKPMSPEEAAFQLELLSQEFFMFRDSSTDSASVIYRRVDGTLGLLQS